ncbi:MAG: PIN domain-containing protein [Melioribacteraceae bacterium]|jgi:predicted nucleic acid-binding protein|nr:PIN domain-containing protein [Melioribacteraceae bacterium]
MTNVLVDTNILLYAIEEDSKYFIEVQSFLNNKAFNFFTTSKNISEFLSVITRIPKNAFPINEALQIMRSLIRYLQFYIPLRNRI